MAYLRAIRKPKCICGKIATVTLVNRYNSDVADYCASCGKEKLAQFNAAEKKERFVATNA